MKNKSILYIGNDLSKNAKYPTTMEILSKLLVLENYQVIRTSNKKNKILRLLDMGWHVIKYRNKIDKILIDTYSTSNFYFALLTSQLARIFNIAYVPILHGGNLPYRLKSNPVLANLIFANSYVNVAPSNYLKVEFEKKGFKTQRIPNILEIKKYPFLKREHLKPNLLWVRSFKYMYNPLLAIDVLNIILKKYPNATLCMIGPEFDNSFEETKQKVQELQLSNNVFFTGGLLKEEWHEISKAYDIFINTTNFDNTPVSVLEAMALGLTIVSTNVGGMPYLIEDGVDGVLVPKENAEAMAKKITELLKSNEEKYAINARFKVEQFDWEVVRNQWKKILV